MKRRGYDIGRVVDLIFEYWLGRMKDSELEEYRHMKETTGLDKYAREFEDREKNRIFLRRIKLTGDFGA